MANSKITLPKVGDTVFSKNGTEFYATITAIKGQRVTVTFYGEYDEQSEDIRVCDFDRKCGNDWDFPNWTFGFSVENDEDEEEYYD